MQPKKVLLLGLLLIVPVLAFLFLKGFGNNHYDLPYYYPETNDEGNAVIQHGDTVFRKIPDFQFTAETGKTISQHDLDNSIYVANFFFASCKGICKKMSNEMVRVQEKFRNNPEVKIVSYTVDPERDSVAALQQYAKTYHAEPNQWYFLTGDKQKIYNLAKTGYLLPVQESEDGTIDFVHSEKFILVDKNKQVRGIYDGTDPKEVDRLITEMVVLLHANKQNEK